MFEFLFRRSAKRKEAEAEPVVVPNQVQQKEESKTSAAQTAMLQADALGSESDAVEFILQCQFADARLKAAALVQSQLMLERVLKHVRNTDRRVAKLMQSRLDTLKQQQARTRQAQQCVEQANRLVQEPVLLANEVAALDRAWLEIKEVPDNVREAFDQARALLRTRLEAQASLQRTALDVVARMRNLVDQMATAASDEAERAVTELKQQMAALNALPEASALPKHILGEFEQLQNRFSQQLALLAQQLQAIQMREEMLERWEAEQPHNLKSDNLKKAWQTPPVLMADAAAAELQTRFDALLQKLEESRKVRRQPDEPAKPAKPAVHDAKQQIGELVSLMERALEDGSLQIASEHDKALRALDGKVLKENDALNTRLVKARAELGRLQSWARWGGNVSREELVKAAEELQTASLPPLELAKKVGSLRERWKSLDVSSGSASKELWERFDAACNTAYAPAAEHFKKLSEERKQNQNKAEALIDTVRQFVASNNMSGDLAQQKEAVNFYLRTSQAWQRLGLMERREKKRLDAEFDEAASAFKAILTQLRAKEIQRREQLIDEVRKINPAERNAVDTLRALQDRWQEYAKSLPLERRDEQALWQRFRQVCDELFAKRKEAAVAADADRQQNLLAKETLCAALEQAVESSVSEMPAQLREAKDAWNNIGPVPRNADQKIEARYRSAVAALQQRLALEKQREREQRSKVLHNKLLLCSSLEKTLIQQQPFDEATAAQATESWQALPMLDPAFERAMRKRFDHVLQTWLVNDRQYADTLDRNQPLLQKEILQDEILLGVDSPSTLARERMELQVEVLQSSLKAGQKPTMTENQLLNLCALPANADEETLQRIERLIVQFVKQGR
jgi:exonuclease SbcC